MFYNMSSSTVFIVIVMFYLCTATETSTLTPSIPEDLKEYQVDEKNYDKIKNMHVNWYIHSVKALMVQLGKNLYQKLSSAEKHRLALCLDKIDDKKDLTEGAKCLIAARRRLVRTRPATANPSSETLRIKYPEIKILKIKKLRARVRPMSVVAVPPRSLALSSPFIRIYNFTSPRFSKYRYRPRREAGYQKKYYPRHGFQPINREKITSIGRSKSPIEKVTNLINQFGIPNNSTKNRQDTPRVEKKWIHTYDKLLRIKRQLEDRESSPGARVYNFRMYDLVLDNDQPTKSPKARRGKQGIMDMAMWFIERARANRKEDADSNTNILSPRLAPLMPNKVSGGGMLSPTVLALYDDSHDNHSVASVPTILKTIGLQKSDREAILDTVMSLSRTTQTVESTLGILEGLNFFGGGGAVADATEKVSEAFDKLDDILFNRQKAEIDRKGFTFLEKYQLKNLYSEQGFKMPPEAVGFIDRYEKLPRRKREDALWARIENIARGIPEDDFGEYTNRSATRQKRDLLSVLQPVILAPYMFAPVYGFSVLGPVILSPSLFSPLILNPAVLSPYILSPGIGMPFILSPYLLSPYILSPLVMAPFILNPYVLSPNILNPYLLSPLILSPLVLCPDVISPMALGGSILSPGVASPAILTETFLMANVLSPTFLS